MRKYSCKKYLLLSLFLILIVIIAIKNYRCFNIQDVFKSSIANIPQLVDEQDNNQEILNQMEENQNTIEKLQQENNNPDIQAILTIDNSNLQEPVAQTTDNDYYLTHDLKKQPNKLGAIYADYRVNLEKGHKILIFGHSSSKKNIPFNQLEQYYEEDYYKQHKYITLETKNNTYRYEIFSVYVETSDFTYMNLNFDTQEEWYLHLLNLQKKSLYQTDITLTEEDDILILQTCSKHIKYQNNSKKYLLIVSRRVK